MLIKTYCKCESPYFGAQIVGTPLRCERCGKEVERTSPAESAQPSEPAGLVERMLMTFLDAAKREHYVGTKSRNEDLAAMTAALAVARADWEAEARKREEELLAPLAEGEYYRTCSRCGTDAINNLLASRRARLGRKKERVTVGATGGHWIVYDNGVEVFHLSRTSYTKQDAERYAAGLRAELAEKEPRQ